jgi:hypothetical protein
MKRIGFIMALFLIASSFSMKLSAQENLDALVKKCEAMTDVTTNVVRSRNPKTKKIEPEIVNITICKNPALVSEFVAAFKKDEENATKAIENKKGGQVVSLYYRFNNGTAYTLSQGNDGCASITIITNQGNDSD